MRRPMRWTGLRGRMGRGDFLKHWAGLRPEQPRRGREEPRVTGKQSELWGFSPKDPEFEILREVVDFLVGRHQHETVDHGCGHKGAVCGVEISSFA